MEFFYPPSAPIASATAFEIINLICLPTMNLYLEYDLTGALLFPQMKCVRPNFMNLLHSIDTVTVFATVIHSPKVIPSLTSLYPKLCYILCLPNYSLSVL